MPQRRFQLPPPANLSDPEIKAAMIVPELIVPNPDQFEGYIKEADLKAEGFEKRDRKVLIALSINDQWSDWQTQKIIDLWDYVRRLDAELVRRKLQVLKLEAADAERLEKEKIRKRWVGGGNRLFITFAAALLGQLGKGLIEWLLK